MKPGRIVLRSDNPRFRELSVALAEVDEKFHSRASEVGCVGIALKGEEEMKFFSALAMVILLSGCTTTKFTGFTDPDFQGKKYSSYVAYLLNGNLDTAQEIESALCEHIEKYGATCKTAQQLFPPTRSYTPDDRGEIARRQGADAVLMIALGGGATSAQPISFQTHSYGNNSSTVPVYGLHRQEGYSFTLLDMDSGRNAMVAGATTKGSGLLNITDSAFRNSLVSAAIKNLRIAGHL